MAATDPGSRAVGYLILRHLYDGDVIEWPIGDDHPVRQVFADLEEQGLVARWDRVWPLHDRYRLTDGGIAAIEAVYRPEGAEAFFGELRQQNLSPQDRRGFIASRGLDPFLWPIVHDPSTHWSTFQELGAPYYGYVWEDQRPMRRTRHPQSMPVAPGMPPGMRPVSELEPQGYYYEPYERGRVAATVVDLDGQAEDFDNGPSEQGDYDVS